MWFLDMSQPKLTLTNKKPEDADYAIFSHRWLPDEDEDGGEVLFQDIKGGSESAYKSKKAGYAKIQGVFEIAKAGRYQYIWMDTCCIDKRNSSDLQKEITSMFKYYKRAKQCYVYLADVQSEPDSKVMAAFRKSQWFTRGWTLQELIAPSDMVFYTTDWKLINTKEGLRREIAEVTGIDATFLENSEHLKQASVAQILSWAAKRETSEKEDIAYCLIGLFDISIPLLYGEGEKHAFTRLQKEIYNRWPEDYSLFAWTKDPPAAEETPGEKHYADSPTKFAPLGNVKASRPPRLVKHEFQIVVVPSLKTYQLKDVEPSTSLIKSPSHLISNAVSIRPDMGVAGTVLRFVHILRVLPSFLVFVGMKKSSVLGVNSGWCNVIRDPGDEDLSMVLKSYNAKLKEKERDFDDSDKLVLRKGIFLLGVVDVRVTRNPLGDGPKFNLLVTVL